MSNRYVETHPGTWIRVSAIELLEVYTEKHPKEGNPVMNTAIVLNSGRIIYSTLSVDELADHMNPGGEVWVAHDGSNK